MSSLSGGNPISEQYDLLSEVGAGAYGRVIKARDKATGEIVAIKEIKPEFKREGVPISVMREVRILRKFHHENIVSLKKVVRSDDTYYLVLEYCDHDMSRIIGNGLPASQVKSLFVQLLLSLQLIHSSRFVHRDIKPSNVLVTADYRVKLADFGLTRVCDGQPIEEPAVTLEYRAPELLMGSKFYGTEIDVWSAGCVLYEMITGRALFYAEDPEHMLEVISNVYRVKLDSDIDDSTSHLESYLTEKIHGELQSAIPLLVAMLQLNPTKRITIPQALEHPFFSGADSLPAPGVAIPEVSRIFVPRELPLMVPQVRVPLRVVPAEPFSV